MTGRCARDLPDFIDVGGPQRQGDNFVMLGNGTVDAVNHWLGLARQMCDAKRSLPAFDTGPRGIDDITHGLLLSELDKVESAAKLETLFVLNGLRRSFQVKGEYLQLPFYRH